MTNLKLCIVPNSNKVPFSPAPESMDISFAEGGDFTNGVELNLTENNQQPPRPARLRQSIKPPLRFGDFVTH